MIRRGEISSRELVELYLERIERHDGELNAYRTVFAERALADAGQADARRGAGDDRPLLGVPIAVKDTEDVAGEVTGMGTAAHLARAERDNDFVGRLRAAGAVVLGKTNLPELAIMGCTEGPAFGVTRNPWDTDRTPGGSSGGSGAAVAAGLCAAATGSDGGGSIRIPASACGLVGLKPQRDRISLGAARAALVRPQRARLPDPRRRRHGADARRGGRRSARAAVRRVRRPGAREAARGALDGHAVPAGPARGRGAPGDRPRGRRAALAGPRGDRARPGLRARRRLVHPALPARHLAGRGRHAAPGAPAAPHARLRAPRPARARRACSSARSARRPGTRRGCRSCSATTTCCSRRSPQAAGRRRRVGGAERAADAARDGARLSVHRHLEHDRPAGASRSRRPARPTRCRSERS